MSKKLRTEKKRELRPVTVKEFIDDYIYRIDLDADYQREKIWSRQDQETLIDSIHKDIDIPKLYLARTEKTESFDFECIDGKQRMSALLSFFKPDRKESPLTVRIGSERYTYKKLRRDLPTIARRMEDYELTLVIYPPLNDEEFVREIFRRLQLGQRLNSGELLKSYTGALRDFVFKDMGGNIPFLRYTNLSDKRFSRQFTLAQICINSFRRQETGDFVRARYDDLGDFFKEKYNIEKSDPNLVRIRKVLRLLEKGFGKNGASTISSRAVAVSAYLFVEDLYTQKKASLAPRFGKFFVKLLELINTDLTRLTQYKNPTNRRVLEDFQKYISQASVEPFAIRRRHEFLEKAFEYYLDKKTEGEILG